MKTQPWAIGIVLFFTLLTSSAQVMYKLAANSFVFDFNNLQLSAMSILTNYYLYIGAVLYIISAILLIIALRGGELSVLYPLVALSYVWVGILSMIILKEPMTMLKWAGVVFIIGGVSCIGVGSK